MKFSSVYIFGEYTKNLLSQISSLYSVHILECTKKVSNIRQLMKRSARFWDTIGGIGFFFNIFKGWINQNSTLGNGRIVQMFSSK